MINLLSFGRKKCLEMKNIEYHPLEPFLPIKSKLLMLGSFPPKKEKWRMDFFYPNFQNDMWRIFGLAFFDDKDYFLNENKNAFDKTKLEKFLLHKGIALGDTAKSVIRHKDNASDNFLEIVEKTDLSIVLEQIPQCKAIVTTGQKASETLAEIINTKLPTIGNFVEFEFNNRQMHFYRMPSSSRAYPKPLKDKASIYKGMFKELSLL